jgi:triphosphatase
MEIEIKYSIDSKETAERLWEDKALAKLEEANSRERIYMKSAYFDTEDYVLSANDIAFRVRMEGSRVVASLKWGGKNDGGFHKREEINVPVNDEACFLMPDPSIFKESEIGQSILKLIDGRPLISLMEIGYLRSRFRVDTGKSLVEVSIDEGELITENGSEPISEVELELFSGDVEELVQLGQSLRTRYALSEEPRSKYARGLNLLHLGKK